MILPHVNATLTTIASPGSRRSYGRPEGADATPKWRGTSDAYLVEKIISSLAGGEGGDLNRVKSSTLLIPGDLEPSVDIAAGDHVTFIVVDRRTGAQRQQTREVADITAPQPPPGIYQFTVKIAFTNAPV